jgi:hypothetical protein
MGNRMTLSWAFRCRLLGLLLAAICLKPAWAQVDVWGSGFDLGYAPSSQYHHRVFVDVNGDGRSDYCRVLGNGQQIGCVLATPSGAWQDGPVSPSGSSGWPEARRWADIDGDGKPEFCRLIGEGAYFVVCTGLSDSGWVDRASASVPYPNPRSGAPGLIDRRLLDFADVNGDGLADLCFILSTYPLRGQSAPSHLHCLLSNGSGFPTSWQQANIDPGNIDWPRSWADVNGDGFADYCRIVGGGPFYIRCTLGGPNGFAGEITSHAIDRGFKEGAAFVDFNGDGKTDYCRVVGTANHTNAFVRCLLSTGTGWAADMDILSPALDWGHVSSRWWIDVNGDGLTDFCRAVGSDPNTGTGATTLSCRLSRGDSFGFSDVMVAGVGAGAQGSRTWCDANGDGRLEFCRVADPGIIHAGLGMRVSEPSVIITFTSGLGVETRVTYQTLTHPDVYTKGGTGGYPNRLLVQPPSFVVRETRTQDRDGRMLGGRTAMHYEQLRVDTEGRGSLGFGKRWLVHEGNNTVELTEYFQGLGDGQGSVSNDFRELGMAKRSQRFFVRNGPDWTSGVVPPDRLLVSETVNTLADTSPVNPAYRFIGTSVQRSWDLNPSQNQVELPTVTTDSMQDFYGNVWTLAQITSYAGQEWGRQSTINSVENWVDPWILGRLKGTRVTHTALNPAAQLARLPSSPGTSPQASANTYTPPAPPPPPPLPPATLSAVLTIIQMLLLDD